VRRQCESALIVALHLTSIQGRSGPLPGSRATRSTEVRAPVSVDCSERRLVRPRDDTKPARLPLSTRSSFAASATTICDLFTEVLTRRSHRTGSHRGRAQRLGITDVSCASPWDRGPERHPSNTTAPSTASKPLPRIVFNCPSPASRSHAHSPDAVKSSRSIRSADSGPVTARYTCRTARGRARSSNSFSRTRSAEGAVLLSDERRMGDGRSRRIGPLRRATASLQRVSP